MKFLRHHCPQYALSVNQALWPPVFFALSDKSYSLKISRAFIFVALLCKMSGATTWPLIKFIDRNMNFDINLWCKDRALMWKKLILSFWQKTRGSMHALNFKIRFITNVSYSMSSFTHPKQTEPVTFMRLKSSLDTVNSSCFARELGRFWSSQVEPIRARQHGDAYHARNEIRQSVRTGEWYK